MFVGGHIATHSGDSDTDAETEEENVSQSDLVQVCSVHLDYVIVM